MTDIRDILPLEKRCLIEDKYGTNSREYNFHANPDMLLVKPVSSNALSFPALNQWPKQSWPGFYVEVLSKDKLVDKTGKTIWDGAEMMIEAGFMEENGWEPFENFPRGQFHSQYILTVLYNRQLWLLKPGIYRIDFPKIGNVINKHLVKSVKNLDNIPRAIKEGWNRNNDLWARKMGYQECDFFTSTYLYEVSPEGVKALIELRGDRLIETADQTVMRLLTKNSPGVWIGHGGNRIKSFAAILGLRHITVESV